METLLANLWSALLENKNKDVIAVTKDLITILRDVLTIIGAVLALLAASRWYKELRVRGRNELAMKTIREIYNVRNQIAVARRSHRSVFFTERPDVLRNEDTVAAFEHLAEDEKNYWHAHLASLEAAVLAMRNESVMAEVIWGHPYFLAQERFKLIIDKWTLAVSTRIEAIDQFLKILHGDSLNTGWSAILISEEHITDKYFEINALDDLKQTSLTFWDDLNKACTALRRVIDRDLVVK